MPYIIFASNVYIYVFIIIYCVLIITKLDDQYSYLNILKWNKYIICYLNFDFIGMCLKMFIGCLWLYQSKIIEYTMLI